MGKTFGRMAAGVALAVALLMALLVAPVTATATPMPVHNGEVVVHPDGGGTEAPDLNRYPHLLGSPTWSGTDGYYQCQGFGLERVAARQWSDFYCWQHSNEFVNVYYAL
jgi:hypothetical protein